MRITNVDHARGTPGVWAAAFLTAAGLSAGSSQALVRAADKGLDSAAAWVCMADGVPTAHNPPPAPHGQASVTASRTSRPAAGQRAEVGHGRAIAAQIGGWLVWAIVMVTTLLRSARPRWRR